MKKIICLTICLCIIFGSFSFAFAAVSDQQAATITTNTTNIANKLLYNNLSAARYLYDIYQQLVTMPTASGQSTTNTRLQTVNNNLADIKQYLNLLNSSVSSIAGSLSSGGSGIATILQNIYNEIVYTDAGQNVIHAFQFMAGRLNTINSSVTTIKGHTTTINSNVADIGLEVLSSFPATVQKLTSVDSTLSDTYTLENNTLPGIYAYSESIDGTTQAMNTLQQVQLPKLEDLKAALTNYNPSFYDDNLTAAQFAKYAHRNLKGSDVTFPTNPWYVLPTAIANGGKSTQSVNWFYGTPIGNLMVALQRINENFVNTYQWRWAADLTNYNSTQTRTNWKTLASETFTPSSAVDGIYKWFGSIQTPIARLASVHASDEEIQAREYAANNQAAVTNNFINPSGTGSVPTSSFGSISSLSSGVKTNLTTDASPSGIFDVFNSSHGSWFSQEIANSLDTTSNLRKSNSYDTPLLDERINEIYQSLGGDKK